MSDELSGNILIVQSGEATVVSNAILAGAISESLNHGVIEEVYGVLGGFPGIMKEDFIDLAEESQQVVRGLQQTPGSALGHGAHALRNDEEVARTLQVLEAHDVAFFVVIGDAEALKSAESVNKAAEAKGYGLKVVGVPQSNSNSIPLTDHCLGYGSVAKYAGAVIKAMTAEIYPECNHDTVCILEVDGGSSGWLAAALTLAKHRNRPEDPPHLVCLPEARFDANRFLEEIRSVLKQQRVCFIVTNSVLFDSEGNYLGADESNGQRVSAGNFLSSLIGEHLGLKVKLSALEENYRFASWLTSKSDAEEALICGTAAVQTAVAGKSGCAVSIQRSDSETYGITTGTISFEEAYGQTRAFPEDWVHDNGITLKHQFYKYASPFIQDEMQLSFDSGLPFFVRLSKRKVERKLESYAVS